jgi:hypothetical protein
MRFLGILSTIYAFNLTKSLVVLVPAHIVGSILRIKLSAAPTTDVELLAYAQFLRSKEDLEANKILFNVLIVEPHQAPEARTHLYLVHRHRAYSRVVPLWTSETQLQEKLPSPTDVIEMCLQNRMNFPEIIENLPEAQVLYRRKLVSTCQTSTN